MPTNTSFSSGFGAGTRLGDVRVGQERNQLFREQQQQQEQTELRAQLDSGFESTIAQVQESAKKFSAAIEAAADDTKRQNIIGAYDKYIEQINASEEEKDALAVNTKLLSSSEAQTRASRLRLSAVLTDPVAETKLETDVKTQGAIDTAEGVLSSKKEFDQFQTDQDIRLKGAPGGQTFQNINTTNLTPPVVRDLQTDVIGNVNRIERLNTIRSSINDHPEYLQVFGKTAASALNLLDKFGVPIPQSGEEFLIAQTKFIRNSIENINAYIKEITGAQMSEKEADRLRLAQPDPGEDIFSGDGPIKFKAKADGAIEAASLAQARSIYFLERGIQHDFTNESKQPPVTIQGMKQVINDKGREEARLIRAQNPDMPTEAVIRQAQEKVQTRYGMSQ